MCNVLSVNIAVKMPEASKSLEDGGFVGEKNGMFVFSPQAFQKIHLMLWNEAVSFQINHGLVSKASEIIHENQKTDETAGASQLYTYNISPTVMPRCVKGRALPRFNRKVNRCRLRSGFRLHNLGFLIPSNCRDFHFHFSWMKIVLMSPRVTNDCGHAVVFTPIIAPCSLNLNTI